MKTFLITITFVASCAFAQLGTPSLEQLKVAADAGDPVAQDRLASRDSRNAEVWYRKAAEQGYAHSEGQLGHRLILRSRMAFHLKPDAKAAMQDEALKWIFLAANQGDRQGQADLAELYLQGELVKQDFVEAYKWGELATQSLQFDMFAAPQGRSARDSAILKMNAEQIAEGRQRAAAFVPHQVQKFELPEPAWTQKIKLGGISGTADNRLAIINNMTFKQGDQSSIKVDSRPVTVRCLEIKESSVKISIEGIDGTRELKMP